MTIEEIKALCASSIHADDDYFGVETYRKALLEAIKRLEQISSYNEYYSGEPASFGLAKIEKLF